MVHRGFKRRCGRWTDWTLELILIIWDQSQWVQKLLPISYFISRWLSSPSIWSSNKCFHPPFFLSVLERGRLLGCFYWILLVLVVQCQISLRFWAWWNSNFEILLSYLQVPSHVLMGIPHSAADLPLSPLGEACSRKGLTAIHEVLQSVGYNDDEGAATEVCI